ncbi:hypothetical protein K4039_25280 [Lyngbya sp. CCAP 1446/10]|uniref:hypothetical protein n=1 Tax=Microcoleaceae TaxID=1892252 RepID=UPI002237DB67|nr:hypothetical protein [Lyngbya sp. CCAP 1446/10]MCW6053290.1 hypothetical protein [Lyngbya sp. CCAP 1446/10]
MGPWAWGIGHWSLVIGHWSLVEAYFQLAIALATARNRVFDQICGLKPVFWLEPGFWTPVRSGRN